MSPGWTEVPNIGQRYGICEVAETAVISHFTEHSEGTGSREQREQPIEPSDTKSRVSQGFAAEAVRERTVRIR